MRLNRWIAALFVLALVAGPVAMACDGGCKSHDHAASETKAACCAAAEAECGADCPDAHVQEALKLAQAAEKGDGEAMDKLVAMVRASGHEDAIKLADRAAGGCEASQAMLIAKVKEHSGDASTAHAASMNEMAEMAGKGCEKSTANLIAAAKKSDDPKMVQLATRAEGGCQHSKQALIAMASEQKDSEQE